jgi:hypothetical protein
MLHRKRNQIKHRGARTPFEPSRSAGRKTNHRALDSQQPSQTKHAAFPLLEQLELNLDVVVARTRRTGFKAADQPKRSLEGIETQKDQENKANRAVLNEKYLVGNQDSDLHSPHQPRTSENMES